MLIDQRPEAVARPESSAQTADIVRAARELGVRIHVQGSCRKPRPGCRGFDGAFAANDVGRYLSFTEVETDVAAMFPPETLARLREVKAAYDPDNAIRGNHAVGAP